METDIKYLSDNITLQDELVKDRNTTQALYPLMLHHGYSVENIVKKLFRQGFDKCGIHIFRDTIWEYKIIVDFMKNFGGSYQNISTRLCELAVTENLVKNESKPKKCHQAIDKAIGIMENLLLFSMTDIFIDYCCFMCTHINSSCLVPKGQVGVEQAGACSNSYQIKPDPFYGEKNITLYIIRFLSANIINLATSQQFDNAVILVKILNTAAAGENERIRNMITRILASRKYTNYHIEKKMAAADYQTKYQILQTNLKSNKN